MNTYLENIKSIIENNTISSQEKQALIENTWLEMGKQNFKEKDLVRSKLWKLIKEIYSNFELYYNKGIFKRRFPQIDEDIKDIDFIIITFTFVVNYYDKLKYTALASMIGNQIIYYYYKIKLNKAKIEYIKNNNIKIKDINAINLKDFFIPYKEFKEPFNNNFIITLGDCFLTFFTNTVLFERVYNSNSELIESSYIKINKDIINSSDLIIFPASMPMIHVPNEWGDNIYGGHLENYTQQSSIISGSSMHNHKITNLNRLYDAINIMSKTKFIINTSFLNYILNEGSSLLQLEKGDILQRNTTLEIAKVFQNSPFYIPLFADWRGRVYTQSFYLSYQGNDLSIALINFYLGESLNEKGKDSLYVYGANLYNENNINKKPYKDRIDWVIKNYNNIINMDLTFLKGADSVYLFAAFCLVIRELDKNPLAKVHLPIFLDATCSGIQHLAALLLDIETAKDVNLIPSENNPEVVQDLYAKSTISFNKYINDYGKKNKNFSNLAKVNFSRSIFKQPIMTITYNVSVFGISQQIKSSLEKVKVGNTWHYKTIGIDNKELLLSSKDIYQIAKMTKSKLFKNYPSLGLIYQYFIDVAKLLNILNLPISWITPSGLVITQDYLKSKVKKLSLTMANKTKKIVIKEITDSTDTAKQAQAIIPNIIHSLDATHVHNLIISTQLKYNFPLLTIHDCFGTLPNYISIMSSLVKLEFVLIYSDGLFLESFHKKLIQSFKDNNIIMTKDKSNLYVMDNNNNYLLVPKLPKKGNLNIKDILKNKYMIN